MEDIKQNQSEGRKIPKKKRKRMEKELARLTKRRDALQREHDKRDLHLDVKERLHRDVINEI